MSDEQKPLLSEEAKDALLFAFSLHQRAVEANDKLRNELYEAACKDRDRYETAFDELSGATYEALAYLRAGKPYAALQTLIEGKKLAYRILDAKEKPDEETK